MDIIEDMLEGQAIYWAPKGINDDGDKTYEDPIPIPCRWEDCREEFIDKAGAKSVSRAKVYVGIDLDESFGVLWEDRLKVGVGGLIDELNPFKNLRAYEIQKFDRLPTLDYEEHLRTAWL